MLAVCSLFLLEATLIKNFGLYWEKERVDWGKPRVMGTLLGKNKKSKKSPKVDFRQQVGIYVLHNDYRAVYVGQVGSGKVNSLFNRLKDHKNHTPEWNRFSWFGWRDVNANGDLSMKTEGSHGTMSEFLNQIEAILIMAINPPRNRQNGSLGKKVDEYEQYREPEKIELRTASEDIKYIREGLSEVKKRLEEISERSDE